MQRFHGTYKATQFFRWDVKRPPKERILWQMPAQINFGARISNCFFFVLMRNCFPGV